MKKLVFRLISLGIAMVVAALLVETGLRLFLPQRVMYPRYQFSPEYGLIPFANTRILHTKPGTFRYIYTTNDEHHRGFLPDRDDPRRTVIVLGDSHSFGMGVNDGEEFPAQLQERLQDTHAIVNLAAPGWGLTQQIRRYHEVGRLYHPKAVLLQFCYNDVEDNLSNPVTRVKEGHFEFVDSQNKVNTIKKYLSRSILQKSHLYNLVRNDLFQWSNRGAVQEAAATLQEKKGDSTRPGESLYADLLETFARTLAEQNIRFIMMAANGQLQDFTLVRERIAQLEKEQLLDYVEVLPWFEGMSDYGSAEGHTWGTKGHTLLAERLAKVLD